MMIRSGVLLLSFLGVASAQPPMLLLSAGGSSGGGGAITLVGTPTCASSANSNDVTISGYNGTGATFFVAVVQILGTPSAANLNTFTWTSAGTAHTSLMLAYASGTGSGSMSFTYSQGATYPAMCIASFAGVNATPTDGSLTNNGDLACPTGDGATCNAGSITPSAGGDLFISGIGDNEAFSSFTIGSSFSKAYVDNAPGTGVSAGIGWKIKTSGDSTAEDPTWTGPTNPNGWNQLLQAFKQ